MARVENIERLQATLRSKADAAKAEGRASVAVSYGTNYALPVHENLEAKHPVGQAKFLEQPARELSSSGEFGRIIREAMQRGATLPQALLLAGLRLQRDSQILCPVEFGLLRSSAATTLET